MNNGFSSNHEDFEGTNTPDRESPHYANVIYAMESSADPVKKIIHADESITFDDSKYIEP